MPSTDLSWLTCVFCGKGVVERELVHFTPYLGLLDNLIL